MQFTCPYCSKATGITAEGLVDHILGSHPQPKRAPCFAKVVDLRVTVDQHNARALANLLSAALAVLSEEPPISNSDAPTPEEVRGALGGDA